MSLNPLFLRLFDDAAIFPPGDLPMPDAVKAHRERLASPLAPLLGPFVCSHARLGELLECGPSFPVALTVPGPSSLSDALTGIDLVAVEGPGLAEPAGTLTTYTEMPVPEISVTRLAALHDAGLRLKIRTGGVRVEAFPTEKDLAARGWIPGQRLRVSFAPYAWIDEETTIRARKE